jgi:RNA polymerase sigma-70 factor, ECF subfamily
MTFDGFRVGVHATSKAEARLSESMAEAKETATLDERVSELFVVLRAPIFNYLTGAFGCSDASDAEDITQEAFIQLYKALRKEQKIENPKGWLFKVAHNMAVNRLKSQAFIAPLGDLEWEQICDRLREPGLNPEQRAQSIEDLSLVHESIKRLSMQERRCLHLRAEGLRYREIGVILDIAVPTVSEFLRRAIKKLMLEPAE